MLFRSKTPVLFNVMVTEESNEVNEANELIERSNDWKSAIRALTPEVYYLPILLCVVMFIETWRGKSESGAIFVALGTLVLKDFLPKFHTQVRNNQLTKLGIAIGITLILLSAVPFGLVIWSTK